MRARLVHQPDTAFGIPERDQILAEQSDTFRLSVTDKIG
jgi:hypothetical protein